MTSRHATAAFPLPDAAVPRRLPDRLAVIAFGAIQWPWLLRSLHGGRKADKAALLDHVGLPRDALPNLGSWKADTHFLRHIVAATEQVRPAIAVELGCGASTLILAKAMARNGGGVLHSYDQHAAFAEATGDWLAEHGLAGAGLSVRVRHAPLGPAPGGWPGSWYQLAECPAAIDLLVIDGPPWAIHPFVRGAAETLFSRLRPGGMVLLDDAARPGERIVGRRWREAHPDICFRLDRRGAKGTLIGIKQG